MLTTNRQWNDMVYVWIEGMVWLFVWPCLHAARLADVLVSLENVGRVEVLDGCLGLAGAANMAVTLLCLLRAFCSAGSRTEALEGIAAMSEYLAALAACPWWAKVLEL